MTFYTKKEYYTRYSQHFFNAIKSLKVTAKMNIAQKKALKGAREALGVDIDTALGDDDGWNDDGTAADNGQSGRPNTWLYATALLLASVGGFFLMKRRS